MKKKSYYIILLSVIIILIFYFSLKFKEFKNLSEYVQPSKEEFDFFEKYIEDLQNISKKILILMVFIPLVIGIWLILKLKNKFLKSESNGIDKLRDISLFLKELSFICDEFILNEKIQKIEIVEDDGKIKINPDIFKNQNFSYVFKKYDLLNINNMLKDLVNGKYKTKIFYQFLENKITLLKSL